MTLYLRGLEVTDLRWYVGHDGADWVRYVVRNLAGVEVSGTISEAEWLAETVEVDDDGQALLAWPTGEAFADVPHGAAQPTAPAQASAPRPVCGGAGGEMEETHG